MATVQTSIDIAAPAERTSGAVSGYAEREADASLARLKQLAEG